jgi:hypothetical protein
MILVRTNHPCLIVGRHNLQLLSSVTARVSRPMVATQQVKGKHNIYVDSKPN